MPRSCIRKTARAESFAWDFVRGEERGIITSLFGNGKSASSALLAIVFLVEKLDCAFKNLEKKRAGLFLVFIDFYKPDMLV